MMSCRSAKPLPFEGSIFRYYPLFLEEYMTLFITFLGGRTEKKSFPSYEEAQLWLAEHADSVLAVSEVVG